MYEFTRAARWFGKFLGRLSKHLSETCVMKSRRPSSSPFARWNRRVRVSVSKGRMLAADRVWQGHGSLPTKPKHVTSAFHGVEFLPKDCARAPNPPL